VSGCWQASVAGVCQGSRRRGSCWWCCGQGVQLVGQCFRVVVLSIVETGLEATTAPVSSSTWKAIAGKRARAKARRHTGSRSGVPWRGRGVGWLASRGCRRVLVLAVLDHRQTGGTVVSGVQLIEQHLEGDRRQVSQGEGQTAHRQPIGRAVAWSRCRSAGRHRLQACARVAAGVARAGGAVVRACNSSGSSAGSSFSRSVKLATKRRRRQRRAAPERQSPASGPGRRPDGTPAADRACRGLVKVSVCWQASVAGVCQGSRRRGSCWWCCGQGVQLVGQFGRVFVLSIGETGLEATTAPASSSTWKAIAGKRARAKARRRTGCRSGGCRGLVG
jgi:hypothetical protein